MPFPAVTSRGRPPLVSFPTILTRLPDSPPCQTFMVLSPSIGQGFRYMQEDIMAKSKARFPSRLGNKGPSVLGSVMANVTVA